MHPGFDGNFDAASGVGLNPAGAEAIQAALADGWADPLRISGSGRRSAILLHAAREALAQLLLVRADEVIFMPSGAHALSHAVLGCLAGRGRANATLVHSAVEHSTVLRAAHWHEAHGGQVQVVGVDGQGRVDPTHFLAAARGPGVAAAVLQAANHEVGTRQPVAAIAQQLTGGDVPLVVDASHDILYGPVPQVPIFTLDARLWGGPPGVGILVVRGGSRWQPPFLTDDSEHGRGFGTPNVPAVVAAVASLRAQRADRATTAPRLSALIELLRRRIAELIPDMEILGDPIDRLPHLLTFSLLYASGELIVSELDRYGFTVSSGSSCTADNLVPSHVLVAMGALTSGNVRVSLPADTPEAAVVEFLSVLPTVVQAVRAQQRTQSDPTGDLGSRDGMTTSRGPEQAPAIIDSRGRRCPLPILDLARGLARIDTDATLTVLADDPAAESDIAAWCRMRGHQLVRTSSVGGGGQAYLVRRLH